MIKKTTFELSCRPSDGLHAQCGVVNVVAMDADRRRRRNPVADVCTDMDTAELVLHPSKVEPVIDAVAEAIFRTMKRRGEFRCSVVAAEVLSTPDVDVSAFEGVLSPGDDGCIPAGEACASAFEKQVGTSRIPDYIVPAVRQRVVRFFANAARDAAR